MAAHLGEGREARVADGGGDALVGADGRTAVEVLVVGTGVEVLGPSAARVDGIRGRGAWCGGLDGAAGGSEWGRWWCGE